MTNDRVIAKHLPHTPVNVKEYSKMSKGIKMTEF